MRKAIACSEIAVARSKSASLLSLHANTHVIIIYAMVIYIKMERSVSQKEAEEFYKKQLC